MKRLWNWIKPYGTKAKAAFFGGVIALGLIAIQDPDLLDLVGTVPDIGPIPTNKLIYVLIPLVTMWLKRAERPADPGPPIAP
jgi:hypothetical protein